MANFPNQTNKLLELKNITKAYSGITCLNNVELDLYPGQVHALVGENGAGKSTLVKIITGTVNKDRGTIKIFGKYLNLKNPNHARILGIAAAFQELSLIPSLTVAENIFLGQELKKTILLDRARMNCDALKILDKYRLNIDPKEKVANLSSAQRHLVEIAKAISLKPRILIMDEPTSALTDRETEIVFRIIEDFKKEGAGIIYVSHRMDEIFKIADCVTVLRDGRLIETNPIKDVDLKKIIRLMVGREVKLYEPSQGVRVHSSQPVFEVKNLTKKGSFYDISFSLYEGEILGICGLVGSGRSEFARAIFGIDKTDSGQILINDTVAKISSVKDALKLGMAFLPESRHLEGLIVTHNLEQNIRLTTLKKYTHFGFVSYKKAAQAVKLKIRELNIKPNDPKKILLFFSGGNQQKAVIAKWLSTDPKILIVDEPTAGIDIHTKSEVHRLIENLTQKGTSVIMISSEMPELLAHSDRILVMNNGKSLGLYSNITQEEIMSLIMKDLVSRKRVGDLNV